MSFKVIVLGCTGGPRENNLSGYLLAPEDSSDFIALDAGTLLSGIDLALKNGLFNELNLTDPHLTPAGVLLQKQIKAYLISHAHLDHILGMVVNSQADKSKPLFGVDSTIDNLRDFIFNGKIWPNLGNEGVEPKENFYTYNRLPPGEKREIPGTQMHVEAFLLSHPREYHSTAFLISHAENAILYLGDTSSDSMEKEKRLEKLWHRVAPLLSAKKLNGIFLECSYPIDQEKSTVYGHLNPHLLLQEFHRLAEMAKTSLEGLPVIVTHRKESLEKGGDSLALIAEELTRDNDLGLHLIFPRQGTRLIVESIFN